MYIHNFLRMISEGKGQNKSMFAKLKSYVFDYSYFKIQTLIPLIVQSHSFTMLEEWTSTWMRSSMDCWEVIGNPQLTTWRVLDGMTTELISLEKYLLFTFDYLL